jgi:hypothetical protein
MRAATQNWADLRHYAQRSTGANHQTVLRRPALDPDTQVIAVPDIDQEAHHLSRIFRQRAH